MNISFVNEVEFSYHKWSDELDALEEEGKGNLMPSFGKFSINLRLDQSPPESSTSRIAISTRTVV